MRQIYADFNDIDALGVLPLTCQGSMTSIAALQQPLRDGEEIILSDGELTVRARVFQRADRAWEARSDWEFTREEQSLGRIELDTMSYNKEIELLEVEWSPDDGFFWRIRQGSFEAPEFERIRRLLEALSFPETAQLPRRLVSLLWYIPQFMEWQVDRIQKRHGKSAEYRGAITTMTNEIERLLGVP